jgi:hypothetical protein
MEEEIEVRRRPGECERKHQDCEVAAAVEELHGCSALLCSCCSNRHLGLPPGILFVADVRSVWLCFAGNLNRCKLSPAFRCTEDVIQRVPEMRPLVISARTD